MKTTFLILAACGLLAALVAFFTFGCQTIPIPPIVIPTTSTTVTTTTTTSTTTTTTLPNGRYCECDLTQPPAPIPYTAEEIGAAGQSQECPVYQGMDIRFCFHSGNPDDPNGTWMIAVPFKDCIQHNPDGTITIHCNPSFMGVQWHVLGWSYGNINWPGYTVGNTFKYQTTTLMYCETLALPPGAKSMAAQPIAPRKYGITITYGPVSVTFTPAELHAILVNAKDDGQAGFEALAKRIGL